MDKIERFTFFRSRRLSTGAVTLIALLLLTACAAVPVPAEEGEERASAEMSDGESGSLIVYSGRNENLVGPLLEQYREATGVDVEVRYGSTAEMAATILEEGQNSPADVFFGQDAGALGALSAADRCAAHDRYQRGSAALHDSD